LVDIAQAVLFGNDSFYNSRMKGPLRWLRRRLRIDPYRPRTVGIIGAVLGICLMAGAPAAYAEAPTPLPPYTGDQSFPAITGPSAPEEYSWVVSVGPHKHLTLVDPQHAEVLYEDGTVNLVISAHPAHAADGKKVPTTLAVSEEDVITLVIHHREGDPSAAGAPFDYPVTPGEGWEVGYTEPVVIKGPPDEAEIREAEERARAAAASAAPPSGPPASTPATLERPFWLGCGTLAASGPTEVLTHRVACAKARKVLRADHRRGSPGPGRSAVEVEGFRCVDLPGSARPVRCTRGPQVIRGPA
jgi:hypothetical protein